LIVPALPGGIVVRGVNCTIKEFWLLFPSCFDELLTDTEENGIFCGKIVTA